MIRRCVCFLPESLPPFWFALPASTKGVRLRGGRPARKAAGILSRGANQRAPFRGRKLGRRHALSAALLPGN